MSSFNDVALAMIGDALAKHKGKQLNSDTCMMMYNDIFVALTEIFTRSSSRLSNEAVNYIAQMYYDSVSLNGTAAGLDPNIFSKRANLDNVTMHDLVLMRMLFKDVAEYVDPFILEIRRRS